MHKHNDPEYRSLVGAGMGSNLIHIIFADIPGKGVAMGSPGGPAPPVFGLNFS